MADTPFNAPLLSAAEYSTKSFTKSFFAWLSYVLFGAHRRSFPASTNSRATEGAGRRFSSAAPPTNRRCRRSGCSWWRVFGEGDGRRLGSSCLRGRAPGRTRAALVRRHWYPPAIPFRRVEILASGERDADAICSEYLGVIAERGMEAAVAVAVVDTIARGASALGTSSSCPSSTAPARCRRSSPSRSAARVS